MVIDIVFQSRNIHCFPGQLRLKFFNLRSQFRVHSSDLDAVDNLIQFFLNLDLVTRLVFIKRLPDLW